MPDQVKIADSGVKKLSVDKKLALGAAVVALSGIVPQPFVQDAHADTATVVVTGAFTGGITLANGVNAQFGTIVPTAATGNMVLTVAGATTPTSSFNNGGTPQAGTIGFSAGAANPVDVTVAGMGTLTLGGAGAAGTATLDRIFMTGPFSNPLTFTGAAGTTTDQILNTALANTTSAINVGARVSWTGNFPVGTFSENVTVTIAY